MRLIFCFFWGGEETKWERVDSTAMGPKEDWSRRCEGMCVEGIVVYGGRNTCAWRESMPRIWYDWFGVIGWRAAGMVEAGVVGSRCSRLGCSCWKSWRCVCVCVVWCA